MPLYSLIIIIIIIIIIHFIISPNNNNNLYPPSRPLVTCNSVTFTFKRFERGPGSSVGIATDYGLDGPRIESIAASVV
jgi:amino acid transporter